MKVNSESTLSAFSQLNTGFGFSALACALLAAAAFLVPALVELISYIIGLAPSFDAAPGILRAISSSSSP